MKIRALEASDAPAFQALRLYALQESPTAFGSSYEEEKARTVQQIEGHLVGSLERRFFGCFNEAALLGVVGVGREQGTKSRHIAFVRSMYVTPLARGQGIGRNLLLEAVNHASAWVGVEQVTLAATASNAPAIELYRKAGFAEVGCMPRALYVGGEYYDELNMVHMLGVA
ncbi:MAG: N-acetyltransferase [Hydrogenophaga sp.]|nr:N-acetyltransferase [Hydrogenophaga sp.]